MSEARKCAQSSQHGIWQHLQTPRHLRSTLRKARKNSKCGPRLACTQVTSTNSDANMNISLLRSRAVLAGAALLMTFSSSEAREFGVSASSYGRGTKYTTSRGGEAYVGPRGAVGETAGGRYGAATDRGVAV